MLKTTTIALTALCAVLSSVAATPSAGALAEEEGHYDAGDRPDPFRGSGGPGSTTACVEERPRISDLEVSGVLLLEGTRVAMAAAGPRAYLLREGDQLCDGELISIETDHVVVKPFAGAPAQMAVSNAAGSPCKWSGVPEQSRLSCASDLLVLPRTSSD